jgi:hypothetical protein
MLTNGVLRVKYLLTAYCSESTSVHYCTRAGEGGVHDSLGIARALRTVLQTRQGSTNWDHGGGATDRSSPTAGGTFSAKAGHSDMVRGGAGILENCGAQKFLMKGILRSYDAGPVRVRRVVGADGLEPSTSTVSR